MKRKLNGITKVGDGEASRREERRVVCGGENVYRPGFESHTYVPLTAPIYIYTE